MMTEIDHAEKYSQLRGAKLTSLHSSWEITVVGNFDGFKEPHAVFHPERINQNKLNLMQSKEKYTLGWGIKFLILANFIVENTI